MIDSILRIVNGVVRLIDASGNDVGVNANPLYTTQAVQTVATYSATIADLSPAASPTDVFTLTGSASKVVRLTKLIVQGSGTNSLAYDFILLKRSTANTGGTSTTRTAVPHDSSDAAATATARAYTANPTLGTLIGQIRAYKVVIPQSSPLGGASGLSITEVTFGDISKAPTLRSTSEVLALNLGAVTLTGGSISISFEWTESAT